jgi:tetratricopeptide (TPR) repeat protein
MVMGTRGFLAPELLMGEPGSASADLYALGVTAAMALTGEKTLPQPSEGPSWARRLPRRGSGSSPHPVGSRLLWSLVEGMLSPDPEGRPTAQEVVKALERLSAPASPLWWATFTAATTLLVAGFGFWSYARGALPEFSSARRARLVVVPIQNHTEDPALDPEAELVTTDLLEHTLRAFPQVQVVQDRGLGGEPPRLQDPSKGGEAEFLRRLLARTGADLVLLGELEASGGVNRKSLRVRLVDRGGKVRLSREVRSQGPDYQPELAVPALLQDISHSLSPLGRPPDLPPLPSPEALEAFGLGLDLWRRGDALGALPHLEKAARLAPRYAPAIWRYGRALSARGDPKAWPTFMWARTAARESSDRYSEAESLLGLALLARRGASQTEEEVPLLEQALQLGEATGDIDLQALVLDQLGEHWMVLENWELADQVLRAAEDKVTATGYRPLRASIRVNRANRAKYLGQGGEARVLYQAAFEDAQVSENPLLQATARNNLAVLDLDEGRPGPAESAIQEVLHLRKELGDVEGECRALLLLGIAAHMQGALDQATARFEAALKGARDHDMPLIQGRALYRLGDVLRARGRLGAAAARLTEGMTLLRKKGTPRNQSDALAALAECRARQGDFQGAERLLVEAQSLAPKGTPQIWRARAWLDIRQGRARAAVDKLAMARALPRSEDPEHQEELQALAMAWRKKP